MFVFLYNGQNRMQINVLVYLSVNGHYIDTLYTSPFEKCPNFAIL